MKKHTKFSLWTTLQESQFVICTIEKPYHIYGFCTDELTAKRFCEDLNKHFNDDIFQVRQTISIKDMKSLLE